MGNDGVELAIQFLLGFAVCAAIAIGLFFHRFWARTRDRLFLIFAFAFWLMALGWVAQAATMKPHAEAPGDESSYLVYIPRLLAFACIIWGIVDKNRAARAAGRASPSVGP
jgi:hypothetical protein